MSQILEMLSNQLDDRVIDQLSAQLGADKGATEQAVSAALPILLGALGRNASSQQGAEALTNALSKDHNGGILDDLISAMGSGSTANMGASILRHVLGGREGNVETALSKTTGLERGQATTLLQMLAPVVMGQLGRKQDQEGLGVDDIARLLMGERQQADSMLGGMAGLLDMDGDGDITDDMLKLGSGLLSGNREGGIGGLLGGLFGRN